MSLLLRWWEFVLNLFAATSRCVRLCPPSHAFDFCIRFFTFSIMTIFGLCVSMYPIMAWPVCVEMASERKVLVKRV